MEHDKEGKKVIRQDRKEIDRQACMCLLGGGQGKMKYIL